MKAQQPQDQTTSDAGQQSAAQTTNTQAGRGNAFAASQLGGDLVAEHPGHENPGGGGELSDEELDAQRPVGTAIPAEVKARLMASLQGAPESNAVLEAIREQRGNIEFEVLWSRGGGYQSRDRIFVDRTEDETLWLSTLAHEIVHLNAYLRGEQGDVQNQSREDYITTQMTEEIQAHASTYVTLLQLGHSEHPCTGFNDFVQWLQANHPEHAVCLADEAEDQANFDAIEELAKPWLEDKYRNVWRGSSSGLNYYEKWGDYWDRVHASD